MNAIDFVVRSRAGTIEQGQVGGEDQGFLIDASQGRDVSLNLRQSDVRGYDRAADDLLVTLADGRVIVLENYFSDDGGSAARFFLSDGGFLNEVAFVAGESGSLYAEYAVVAEWGKWSPDDTLIFFDRSEVVAGYANVDAGRSDDDGGFLAAGLLGGGGLLMSAVGAGAAAVMGGGLIASDGDGGGGDGPADPTVSDTPITIGGDDVTESDRVVVIEGTGNPEDTVTVTVGDKTGTAIVDERGDWSVTFEGDDFPGDGSYTANVVVSGTSETSLDGPAVVIDTTPPVLTIDEGTVAVGDVTNAAEHPAGVIVSGTTEIGADVSVIVGGVAYVCDVDASGNWSVTLGASVFAEGEYSSTISVIATDSFGNSTTLNDAVQVDTVPHPITIDAVTADNVVNAAESDSVTVTGTSTAGASMTLTFGGETYTGSADASGVWAISLPASAIASGEYDAGFTVSTSDRAGNASSVSGAFRVDTEGSVTISPAPVEGDDVVNAAERADGVTLTGTAEAGSTVEVSLGGVIRAATVSASGAWSVDFAATDLPQGEQVLAVTATATDAAGNVTVARDSFAVDTQSSVTLQSATVEGDGVINAFERMDGVQITGTTDAGSSVVVTMNGTQRAATVDGSGNWTVLFSAAEVPHGEQSVQITATATDAAGNASTATGTVEVDTFVRDFAVTSQPGGEDAVINTAEAAQGLTVTGTTEPGATVELTLGGVTRAATVASNGDWSVSFAAGELPSGEQSVTMTARSTDAAGNVALHMQQVTVDTHAGTLTISPAPVEGDDVVNAAEASDGVTLTGTSDPGQFVEVTLGGVTRSTQTGHDGIWRAGFLPSEIAPGTYEAQITATIEDMAGNTLTRTDSVRVDTEVQNFAVSAAPVTADNVVNGAERGSGVVLSGSTEPGASVTVTVEGVTRAASVDAQGNWSVAYGAADLPTGTYATQATVSTTDAAGNTATASKGFKVDTQVDTLATSGDPITADGVLNAAESAAGFTLTGEVEPGSSVTVTMGGMALIADVAADGAWSVDVPSQAIPSGDGQEVTMVIDATDAAGNTRSITETVAVDNVAPDLPEIASYTRDHTGIRGISLTMSDDDVGIGHVTGSGAGTSVDPVGFTETDIAALGETAFTFDQVVPDGSHLVVTSSDAAGNMSGTYLVVDDTTTSAVDMSGAAALGAFEIKSIDLQFAEDSQLTITEAQIVALAQQTDELRVYGGSDDAVTITGATRTGNRSEDGETFEVYELGDATVLIEDDITNVTI